MMPMDSPDGISAEIWDAANEADRACQQESCKDIGCNGFLCANALRAAILKAREDAFEEAAQIVDPIETDERMSDHEKHAHDLRDVLSQAIRQHSQKGER